MYGIKIDGKMLSTYSIKDLKGKAEVNFTDSVDDALTFMTFGGAETSAHLLKTRVSGSVKIFKLEV